MKVVMGVIDVKELDDYIDSNSVPFVVCTPPTGVTSNRQQRYLEKYYDKVVDRRGWVSYYCNIINAWKCRSSGFQSIQFPDGQVDQIKKYKLERNVKTNNRYLVVPQLTSGKKVDSLSLVKMIRMSTEKMKKQVNMVTVR